MRRTIEPKGETGIRVIATDDGRVINTMPKNLKQGDRMKISYTGFTTRDLQGSTLAELLVNIEADLEITDNSRVVFQEYLVPVAELARALVSWTSIPRSQRTDFALESLSWSETGAITITETPSGWTVGTFFPEFEPSSPQPLDVLDEEVTAFIRNVCTDVKNARIDPAFIGYQE